MNKKYNGITDNAEVSWNGRARIVSDISDPALFNLFFDSQLPEMAKRMILSINETNLRGEDLGDVIPCDHLNSAAIEALKNQILDEAAAGFANMDNDGTIRGVLNAECVVPDCILEAEEYMASIEFEDDLRNSLFEKLNKLSVSWEWPVEICVNGKDATLKELDISAINRILEQMLYHECMCGIW